MKADTTRTALQIALGVVTLLLAARGILSLASYPPNDPLWAKMEWVEAKNESYEVLFFGSSRIRSGVVPEIFDRVAAEHGWTVRSFNLAGEGNEAQNVDFMIRRALKARLPGWRYAVVEVRPWLGRIWWENSFSPRTIYFHDAASTRDAVFAALTYGRKHQEVPVERLHLLGFAARLTAAGRGPDAVDRLRATEPPWAGFDHLIESRGYAPPDWPDLGAPTDCFGGPPGSPQEREERRRLEILRSPWTPPDFVAETGESLDELRRRAAEQIWLQPFRRQEERLRDAGIVPIFLTPSLRSWTPDLAAHGVVETFFAYDDPQRFPELTLPEHRYDCSHLDDSGARIFSRILARDLARWVTGGDRPGR